MTDKPEDKGAENNPELDDHHAVGYCRPPRRTQLKKGRCGNPRALKLLRKLLNNQGIHPEAIVTDGLASYHAAVTELECKDRHRASRLRDNNRAETLIS